MPNPFRNPVARLFAAHAIACYVWVGAISLYAEVTRREPTPTIEPGFHDADGDGFDDAHDDPDPWYLRGPVVAITAPVSVPCLLLSTVLFTIASPVERFPVSMCLILLALYFVPLGTALALIRRLQRRRGRQTNGHGGAVLVSEPNGAGPDSRPDQPTTVP